jgi:hypothetical protein
MLAGGRCLFVVPSAEKVRVLPSPQITVETTTTGDPYRFGRQTVAFAYYPQSANRPGKALRRTTTQPRRRNPSEGMAETCLDRNLRSRVY